MNRQTVKRLMVKGIMTYAAVFALVLMVAMPAMAVLAARNSVGRRQIINGEVTYRDIAKNAVRTGKIAPKAVRYGKIADGAVRGNHIKDGHVKSADIGDGSIKNADIASGAAISESKIKYFTKIGYLSIPAAALTRDIDGAFTRSDTLSGGGTFHAPVNLPNGAKVTRFQYKHFDNSGFYTDSGLRMVVSNNSVGYSMAGTNPSGNAGFWQTAVDTTIDYSTIDNLNNAYYVIVNLTGTNTDLKAGNILIEYTYTSPGH